MFRPLLIFLSPLFLGASCTSDKSKPGQPVTMDHPTTDSFHRLPKQIHAVGTIGEVSYGYCGLVCQGGYIKVDLDLNIANYNFKMVYLITVCLSKSVKQGNKVDVTATLHTGQEEECYYKSFDTPKSIKDIVFYQLTETESQMIR